jgi:hypothetical protein
MELAGSVVPAGAAGHDLMLADLAGGAATQLHPGQAVLNLLPPSRREEASRHRQVWLVAAALVTSVAVWQIMSFLHPAAEPLRPVSLARQEELPQSAESPEPSPAAIQTDEEVPFRLELLDVKTTPFPLQLAGFIGEPGDYLVAFISAGRAETLLARRGHRFPELGLTMRSFEVRKIAVDHGDAWPVYEAAAIAVLHDEKTDGEVVLDSRRKPPDTLQAVLRGAPDGQLSTRQVGDLVMQGAATYLINRIQADPPEVVIVRQTGDSAMSQTLVLRPVPATVLPGEQPAEPETVTGPSGL